MPDTNKDVYTVIIGRVNSDFYVVVHQASPDVVRGWVNYWQLEAHDGRLRPMVITVDYSCCGEDN